jgi:ribose 5-phosphate isomerase A
VPAGINDTAEARRAAAARAVELVEPDMVVGLGSGDTAAHAVRALAERVRAGLRLTGVPTSRATAELAGQLGIMLVEPDDVEALDLTIDGADEIDPELRLVKGAGGALVRERLVARASRRLVIVADDEKLVPRLGAKRRLPVEILPFGTRWTLARLGALGLDPRPRMGAKSDGGGLLVDCAIGADVELGGLAATLKGLPGVVDHGLFLDEASEAFIGFPDHVERRSRSRSSSSSAS